MLRAKRRRTRMHDSKGNPIFNTNNATSKQNRYVMKNNYLESLKIRNTRTKRSTRRIDKLPILASVCDKITTI